MNNYYVYFHKKKDTNQIFYVGRGKGKRAWSDCRDKFWKACVKKHGLIVEIIHENLTLEESCIFEIKYIKLYGRRGYDENGILLNRSLGGEFGPTGFKYSEESKKKMSNSQKGKKLNQETKNKISKAKTGNKLSKESCEKISKAKKGHVCFNDEKRGKKISETLREGNHTKYYTKKVREKMSKNMKGSHGGPFTEDHIKNLTKGNRKRAKALLMYDLQGNLIKEWVSKGEAAIWIKKNDTRAEKQNITSQIKDCCFGRMRSCWGYIWRYKGDNLPINPKFKITYQFDDNLKLINTFNNQEELRTYFTLIGYSHKQIISRISRIKKNLKSNKFYKTNKLYYSYEKQI